MKYILLLSLLLSFSGCTTIYESDFGARPLGPKCLPGGLAGPVDSTTVALADSLYNSTDRCDGMRGY